MSFNPAARFVFRLCFVFVVCRCFIWRRTKAELRARVGRPHIAGRPKATLLFWLFGGFRCGVPLFIVMLVVY